MYQITQAHGYFKKINIHTKVNVSLVYQGAKVSHQNMRTKLPDDKHTLFELTLYRNKGERSNK